MGKARRKGRILSEVSGQRDQSDIRALGNQVDIVIVLTHWGTQYTHRPEPSQRVAAQAFADAGADLVIGGHPHGELYPLDKHPNKQGHLKIAAQILEQLQRTEQGRHCLAGEP